LRIVRYTPNRASEEQAPRLGLMLGDDRIGDLRRAHERMLAGAGDRAAAEIAASRFPGNLAAHLAGGDVAHQALLETAAYLGGEGDGKGGSGDALIRNLDQCRLLAPMKPWKIIAVGRNYGSHDKEMSQSGAGFPKAVPSAWIKSNSALAGPFDDIQKPAASDALDYETELTLVISRQCKNVAEKDAYDVIAGYMVGIDVTARDVVRLERAEGNQLMGKMFDSFAPMGPWMLTADEVPDPMNLPIRTRVNGEIRQDGSTAGMIWDIPKLISYVSQMSLEPGDLIMTGTPSGVAAGHKVDGENWFLSAGDVLESEIEGIGALRNTIVDAPDTVHWDWDRSRNTEPP
jgi:2-keto-4-pentenoate hydratase/2-oxohepta-3-ene-1,7-dioic acid hydratase in catechol pathway